MRKTIRTTTFAAICSAALLAACGDKPAEISVQHPQSVAAASAPASAPAAAPAPSGGVSIQQAKDHYLSFYKERPSDLVVRGTFVPGLFKAHSTQALTVVYFEPKGLLWGDRGVRRWERGENALPADESVKLRRERAAAIPKDALFVFSHGKGGAPSMILTSAVNCGSCAALERELSGMDVSYRAALIVNGSDASDMARLDAAACSKEPQKAWEAMRDGKPVPGAACQWQGEIAKDVGDLVTGDLSGVTPTAYFPDGTTAVGREAVLRKLKETIASGASL
jgi:hypothetical protein